MVVVIATVVIRDDEGRTLLVNDNGIWAIPGGKVEKGEGVIEAAEREMKEETGYLIEIDSLARVYELKKEGDYHLFFVFKAKIVKKLTEGTRKYKWFKIDEIGHLNAYPETYLLLKELEKKIPKCVEYPLNIRFYF